MVANPLVNIEFLLSSWDKTYVTCNNGKFFPRDPMRCIGAMPAGIIRKCCVNVILEKWMLWDLQEYMHNFPFSLASIRTLWPSETGFELFLA